MRVNSEPQASGRAFRGVLKTLKEQCTKAVSEQIVRGAGYPEVFGQQIRSLGWYPYRAYRELLISAERIAGKGDGRFCWGLGNAGGRRDVSTVLRVYIALSSPERLIRSCAKVWPTYYANAGRMEALTWAPSDTTLRIYDFPSMHPLHCRLMEGWMIATMEVLGFQVSNGFESECVSRGGAYHEFTCTWTRSKESGSRR